MNSKRTSRASKMRSSVAALAITTLLGAAVLGGGVMIFSDGAFAQGHDGGSKGSGGGGRGGGGSGGSGGHDDGDDDSSHDDESHDDDTHDDSAHDDGHESGGPRGGRDETGSDGGQGLRFGGGTDENDRDGRGQGQGQGQGKGQGQAGAERGRPVWAAEGIPEVELGRLNVARSPERVLDRAYREALANMSDDVKAFYGLSYEEMLDRLVNDWDNVTFIDSPLQNLALLRDALDGESSLAVDNDRDTLMAVFLGTASDKSLPITTDTARAISAILGQPLSPEDSEDLARRAELVRLAILAGHG